MHYGYTSLATTWRSDETNNWKTQLLRWLLFFIPRANLDNEKLYPQLVRWLIEIDADGIPNREIGLDALGNPLFGAPNSRNSGFWTDSNKVFATSELEMTDQKTFEDLWARAEALQHRKT